MDYDAYDNDSDSDKLPATVKILIAGGFGVGKTTMVGAVSEIRPLYTEEVLSERSADTDPLSGVQRKMTTTVALDFGRLSIGDDIVLYLFGTPGQERFWFMWDELALGALGAVVLADTRRLSDCFPAVDYFEQRQTPFLVAVNCFDGARRYATKDVEDALDLGPGVPILMCDARHSSSCRDVLVALVDYTASQLAASDSRAPG